MISLHNISTVILHYISVIKYFNLQDTLILQDLYCNPEKLLYKYCDFTSQYLYCNFKLHSSNKIPLNYSKIINISNSLSQIFWKLNQISKICLQMTQLYWIFLHFSWNFETVTEFSVTWNVKFLFSRFRTFRYTLYKISVVISQHCHGSLLLNFNEILQHIMYCNFKTDGDTVSQHSYVL